jgi:two-component system response regulator BaeR
LQCSAGAGKWRSRLGTVGVPLRSGNAGTTSLAGRRLHRTPVEFRLLALLAASPGRVYCRDRLVGQLYDGGRVVLDRTVDTHVKETCAANSGVELIHSVYGVGFKLEIPAP